MTTIAIQRRCAEIVREAILRRRGDVVTEELAIERANNAATALLDVLLDMREALEKQLLGLGR